MDQKRNITAKELEDMYAEGFDFDDVIGQSVSLSIKGIKHTENLWKMDAVIEFGMSLDGINWATRNVPVEIQDDSYDAAVATTMLVMANTLNDPMFLASVRKELNSYKELQSKKGIQ